jgi:hypothetical protein
MPASVEDGGEQRSHQRLSRGGGFDQHPVTVDNVGRVIDENIGKFLDAGIGQNGLLVSEMHRWKDYNIPPFVDNVANSVRIYDD